MIILLCSLLVIVTIVIFPPLLAICQRSILCTKQQIALEAASLAAARDLGKIVVDDPYFGYISLSDYPPCGKATLAGDGEPLPVLGINTVIGTARLETIVANALGNPELCFLAQQDMEASRQAAKRLQDVLRDSLNPGKTTVARDLDGNLIKPYDHALQVFLSNFPTLIEPVDFQLSLGWLDEGSSTVTPIPQPIDMASVPATAILNGNYKSFMDIPACGESFYFAGVGQQPGLVDSRRFVPEDGKGISSIVKAESILTPSNLEKFWQPGFWQAANGLYCVACAQPSSLGDCSMPGALVLSLPDGYAPGLRCIRDLFTNRQLNARQAVVQTPHGGDFPNDSKGHLEIDQTKRFTLSSLFEQGFYDWLRTAHCRPRIDAVLQAVDSYFGDNAHSGSGVRCFPLFIYEFDKAGNVVIINHREIPFLAQTVDENQLYALSFQAMTAGTNVWSVSCRDQVNRLGTQYGGKHAGQSMPGDPVNWCDLARFDGSLEQAKIEGKGNVLGIAALGEQTADSGIALDTASFEKLNGAGLEAQPRKNYYAGGLAVEFRLSSTAKISQN
jgi:hypothetical protein